VNEEWDGARYAREKRDFIESRQRFRWIYLHTALIFTVTWLAGWLCSAVLLRAGMHSMPTRYALGFGLSYLVFLACVRVWAGLMRRERGKGPDWDGGFDLPGVDAEGCGVVLVALVLGLLVAGLFAFSGGLPLLLEAAFEVVFAGVVVRRISRKHTVGDWVARLVRNTWPHALVTLVALVGVAAWLQHKVPGSQTFAQAAKSLL